MEDKGEDVNLISIVKSKDCDNANDVIDGNLLPNLEVESVGLKRQIGLLGMVAFLVGSIIGGGIFAAPRSVAIYAGSTGAILLVWVGAGIVAIIGALVFCELSLTFPDKCAGEYSYIYEAFGNFPAFATIYLTVLIKPAAMALVCIIAGDYIMTAITGQGDSIYSKGIAAGIIVINMLVNCFSVKLVEKIQIVFTTAKMIPVIMLIVTGLVRLSQGHTGNFQNAFNGSTNSVSDLAFAIYGGLYAYRGWDTLNYVCAESVNPARNIPIAIAIGIPLVIISYILVNMAYLTVKTPLEISKASAIAVDIGNTFYGDLHWIIPAFVACSVIGVSNTISYKIGRELYEAANQKHLPSILGAVHLTRHTPIPAIVFSSTLACIVLIPESTNFKSLLNFVQFFNWLKLSVAIASMLWLRKSRPNIKRPLKIFIGIPIVFFVLSLFLVIAPFVKYPVEQAYGICILLPVIPLYFGFIRYKVLPISWRRQLSILQRKIEHFGNLGTPSKNESEEVKSIAKVMDEDT